MRTTNYTFNTANIKICDALITNFVISASQKQNGQVDSLFYIAETSCLGKTSEIIRAIVRPFVAVQFCRM
jgi:hypothetical protein